MSVAFSPCRTGLPDLHPNETALDIDRSDTEDRGNPNCAWSFCNGEDRELSASAGETFNLINLREVNINYGSQPIESDSDTDEATQACEIPDRVMRMAPYVALTTMGFLSTAGLLTLGSVGCWVSSQDSSDDNSCAITMGLSVPYVTLGLMTCAIGVKKLVEAYKERNAN